LHEEAAALRMLFLNTSDDCQSAIFDKGLNVCIPTWYVSAASRSPRSEVHEQELPAAVLPQQHRLPIRRGQNPVFVSTRHISAHLNRIEGATQYET
jgi:hypothetical protein